jgi:hypothetical protein
VGLPAKPRAAGRRRAGRERRTQAHGGVAPSETKKRGETGGRASERLLALVVAVLLAALGAAMVAYLLLVTP